MEGKSRVHTETLDISIMAGEYFKSTTQIAELEIYMCVDIHFLAVSVCPAVYHVDNDRFPQMLMARGWHTPNHSWLPNQL